MIPDRALNPEDFRAIVAMHGVKVKYYRAHACPCRNPQTGDFSRDCPLILAGACDGAFVYREETLPGRARVYFDRAKKTIDDAELGLITVGDLMAYSMPDWVPLERMDKLVITDWTLEARETRERVSMSSTDPLIQLWPFALDSVSWLNGAQWQNGVIGSDCELEVSASGVGYVKWLAGGNAPASGENYSVIYRYRPSVFVGGASFMPSRVSVYPRPGGDINDRYGLPIRALMTFQAPQANSAG